MQKKLNPLFAIGFVIASSLLFGSCSKKDSTKDPDPVVTPKNNCRITGIKVLEIPDKDGFGDPWDAGDGPDLYVEIDFIISTVFSDSANRINNVTTFPVEWTFATPFDIGSFSYPYVFSVRDYDSPGPDGYIEGMEYTFSSATTHPTKLPLEYAGTKIELSLEWY